ncbi:hypothetical protein [Chondromyces crocatus]|uniref:PEGA domain-containing protein n=1 Tax=Chondromyces crocatus TaxID=52 RepID=A0A0K1EBN7_CHOCO|nr:hypothetical protein [Chondromyces crocatus]AKT38301.1 uncharacterized protein CMC5_024460 [Chondromyces crocatus]
MPGDQRPRWMRRALVASLLSLTAVVAAPRPVLAQDAGALLDEGKKLMAAGKLAEACPKLEESYKLGPSPSALYQVALCHEKQGKIATAYVEFIDAEAEARKAGNKALQQDAKVRSAMLESRIPRLTVKVPKDAAEVEGLQVRVDETALERGSWNQAAPVNPGEHKVSASAPGRKPWDKTVKLRAGSKESVTVPALAVDASASLDIPEVPEAHPADATKPGEAGSGGPATPVTPAVTTHRAGRFVFDVGVGPSLLVGLIDRGTVSTAPSYDYEIFNRSADGMILPEIAVCTVDTCQGVYDPSVGLVLGGQAFVGYALQEDLHVGARVLGGVRLGGGYTLLGGPSVSKRFGSNLWAGLSLLVGGVANDAKPVGVRGEIPAELQEFNEGATEVAINVAAQTPLPASEVVGTFAFGGAVEISYQLLDNPSDSWHSGALMVSAWPTFLKGLEGFAISVPVTLGYRFY